MMKLDLGRLAFFPMVNLGLAEAWQCRLQQPRISDLVSFPMPLCHCFVHEMRLRSEVYGQVEFQRAV